MRAKRKLTDGEDRDHESKDTVKKEEESDEQRSVVGVASNTTET